MFLRRNGDIFKFFERKKEEEKERKSDEIEAELQNDLDEI